MDVDVHVDVKFDYNIISLMINNSPLFLETERKQCVIEVAAGITNKWSLFFF